MHSSTLAYGPQPPGHPKRGSQPPKYEQGASISQHRYSIEDLGRYDGRFYSAERVHKLGVGVQGRAD